MSFFTIKKGELYFDLEYVLLHEPLKDLFDETSKQNNEHIPYFKYLYEIADNRSYSNKQGLSDNEAHKQACDLANLDYNFIKPKSLNNAIKHYRSHNYSLNADTLRNLIKTLNKTKKINARLNESLDNYLDTDKELTQDNINSIIKTQSSLFDLIDKLPEKIEKIKVLEAKVFEEVQKKRELIRGGHILSPSLDGDSEIEGTS